MNELQDLKGRVKVLEDFIRSMEFSYSFPRDVETAISERLGNNVLANGTGAATSQNIGLSGNPETITVPAQPSGTLKVVFNRTTYELLYK